MKNGFMKKIIPSLLCIVMLVSMLAGCGGDNAAESSNTAAATTAGSTAAAASADPLAEKVSLKIAMQSSPNVEDFETNWLTQQIEKEFNVDLSFEILPADYTEAATKFSLLVGSGSKLPDVLNIGLTPAATYDYGSKGTFVDVSSYFKDAARTPNFNQMPQPDQEFLTLCSLAPDGKIYNFPKYEYNQWNQAENRVYILQDWLKAVGKEVPTTTDELYDVLKAFVATDINGNGKKDEIGIVGGTGWAQDPVVFLMNAFLYANKTQGYFDVKDGKIISSFTQPEWKAGLEYINKLVNEGLLSPLSFTQDNTQLKTLINVEKGMAGIVPSGSYGVFDAVTAQTVDGKGYKLMAPVKGPSGKAWTAQNPTTPGSIWSITKDCANVERAVMVGDYFLDENKFYMFQFGEPGVEMSIDPAVTKDYVLSKALMDAGWSVECAVMVNNWLKPQNKTWQNVHPIYKIRGSKAASDVHKDSEAGKAGGSPVTASADFIDMYVPLFRPNSELIVRLPYTEAETTAIADTKTAIDAYVLEQTVAFATGKRPISDWDKYLSELEKMGLKKYIEASQAAYDRFGK